MKARAEILVVGYFEGRDGSPSRPDAGARRPCQRKLPTTAKLHRPPSRVARQKRRRHTISASFPNRPTGFFDYDDETACQHTKVVRATVPDPLDPAITLRPPHGLAVPGEKLNLAAFDAAMPVALFT